MGKSKKKAHNAEDILQTLTDFTSKDNWDKFFTLRGTDDAFEWYAEWSELKSSLLSELASLSTNVKAAADVPASHCVQILVPGCGSSKLSEQLYDAGFHGITNIDYSKVVISDMLRRNVRERPDMRWRVMDMTSIQFVDSTFDAIVDKGAFDALMEPGQGHSLGIQYLTEAMRVLKPGGKFFCFTLAETHVLGLLFSKFRVGWKMIIHAIPQKPSSNSFQTFMVIASKEAYGEVHQITSFVDISSRNRSVNQINELFEELKTENRIRKEYSSGSDILHSLEDLTLGSKGNLEKLRPGLRVHLNLGDQNSRFSYRALLLDAPQPSGIFSYHCGVMLVPKSRTRGWLYSSEEGQWILVENSKAARLIMVFLDSSHLQTSVTDIQTDLSRLVKLLEPATNTNGCQIPFMMVEDALKERHLIHEVVSPMIGAITIDDVVYNNEDKGVSLILPDQDLTFRRLIFKRNEDLVQSEALLIKEELAQEDISGSKSISSSKPKKKKGHKPDASGQKLRVSHDYLASPYHCGIISGFMLISSYMESLESAGKTVRAAVIGLGAGLLPMFLHGAMPFMQVEVVELDPIVVNVARKYFSLSEDSRLKVYITDGLKFIKEAASESVDAEESGHENVEKKKIDILMIDVDNNDTSSGLSCPAANFVEEHFLHDAKNSISDQGLFVLNVVSRSPVIKARVLSRVRKVFNCVYTLEVEGDVNDVVFALKSADVVVSDDLFPAASARLEKLLRSCRDPLMSRVIVDASKGIKYYCNEEDDQSKDV